MRRWCFGFTRTLLIITNILVGALAGLLVWISFTAFDQNYELDSLSDSHPRLVHTYVSVMCAGLGVVILLLAILGFLGAYKKSKPILITYAFILISMVVMLAVLVLVTFSLNNSPNASQKEIDKSFVNSTVVVYNYVDTSDMKTRIIDNIQKTFSCCGVNSPNDWTEYSLHKIPRSCCSEPVESSLPVFKYCAESDHKIGCWKALSDHFYANLATVRIILYVLMSFGLVCTLAALFMITNMRKILDMV